MNDWTVPPVARIHEPVTADERATLDGLLEWHRSTFVWKCAGLTGEQLALRPVPPSSLSLLGLIRHLTDAERAWFRRRVGGLPLPEAYARPDRPEAAFEDADPASAQADLARLTEEWEALPPSGGRGAAGHHVRARGAGARCRYAGCTAT